MDERGGEGDTTQRQKEGLKSFPIGKEQRRQSEGRERDQR